MSTLAPYANAMRLGQGFNSYTQEICLDSAVLVLEDVQPPEPLATSLPNGAPTSAASNANPPTAVPLPTLTPPGTNPNQIVTYSSRSIDNMADIIDAFNISSSLSIKYGTIKASGSASYVNENKVNDSDLNFIVSVKVTNETPVRQSKMEFQQLDGLRPEDFTNVYGDCFISGFLEGGEFAAIISIKVHDKGRLSQIKAAAEATLAVGPPGLSMGGSGSMGKEKSSVFQDTESTISVNWSGGGDIKPPDTTWDLASVVKAANEFPKRVAAVSSRTSAILTRYTALRSFHEANAKTGYQYRILDYDLCSLYTMDLFSSYMAYKHMWTQLSDMLKRPQAYKAVEKSRQTPDPIQTDPVSLDLARLDVRKALVEITNENKRLVTDPEIANVRFVNGKETMRAPPYLSPAIFAQRLPRFVGIPVMEQANHSLGGEALTAAESAEVKKYCNNSALFFSPLSGDALPTKRTFGELFFGSRKDGLFCTLDCNPTQDVDKLSKIRIHAHQHHVLDNGIDSRFSKEAVGGISCIGFTTLRDGSASPGKDGVVHRVGRPSYDPEFMSRIADVSTSGVDKVLVEYVPGKGYISGLTLYSSGLEVASRKQWDGSKPDRAGVKEEWQTPPTGDGTWVLVGFWGHSDLLITRLGIIWRRV